jgi:hypothetical protein
LAYFLLTSSYGKAELKVGRTLIFAALRVEMFNDFTILRNHLATPKKFTQCLFTQVSGASLGKLSIMTPERHCWYILMTQIFIQFIPERETPLSSPFRSSCIRIQ